MRNGPAASRLAGCDQISQTISPIASAGAIHSARQRRLLGRPVLTERLTCAAEVHCSRWRREIPSLNSVRMMASSALSACTGRMARDISQCRTRCCTTAGALRSRSGARRRSANVCHNIESSSDQTGTAETSSNPSVHTSGLPGSKPHQATTKRASIAGASKLRRRLSRIFQR